MHLAVNSFKFIANFCMQFSLRSVEKKELLCMLLNEFLTYTSSFVVLLGSDT